MRGGSCDRLFCRHIFSLSPSFGKDLLTEEMLRLLDAACATETFDLWERHMTGFAVTFCRSPQSRCPCGLSLTCDNIRQLFQAQDQRSPRSELPGFGSSDNHARLPTPARARRR